MTERMSVDDYIANLHVQARKKAAGHKYGAIAAWRCLDCGAAAVLSDQCSLCDSKNTRRFDSKAEAKYYDELRLRQTMGLISGLDCQSEYVIEFNGMVVGKYLADFEYVENGQLVVVDVKGGKATDTPLSRFKRKCVKALHGIDVQVVRR